MTRGFALALAALVIGHASGCSIIDRLFLLNTDGPHAHHARHAAGGYGVEGDCPDGGCPTGDCQTGACQTGDCQTGGCQTGGCQTGGCQDCEGGVCRVPHTGRYGGLAKHHLSPAEKAALAGTDYGAIGPAGPPTGAVAYPYYTTRGPRDFLAKRPPSIGPQ
jgi:hypothetical protein